MDVSKVWLGSIHVETTIITHVKVTEATERLQNGMLTAYIKDKHYTFLGIVLYHLESLKT